MRFITLLLEFNYLCLLDEVVFFFFLLQVARVFKINNSHHLREKKTFILKLRTRKTQSLMPMFPKHLANAIMILRYLG